MILLKPELSAKLAAGGVAAVQSALQQAIELEHATIPLYLYGLYSLDVYSNGEIAGIIQSVAVEEMLHMTLACNILNALGGSPMIDQPGFIPTYPGPLPGGVDSSLVVHLAPFSYEQLDTYLSIEEPEDPLNFGPGFAVHDINGKVLRGTTIGQFYTQILAEIEKLPDSAFVSPPNNQIGPDQMEGAVVVTDKASAKQAIDTIIEQGEGTSTEPTDDAAGELAHYYRFMEIKMGRKLIPVPGSSPVTYAYAGEVIRLDPNGIFPVPTDPSLAGYASNAAAYNACATFNYTYTNLLKVLHQLFNGGAVQFDSAIALMMSLKGQAKAMMSGIPNPALQVGPSFEYQPVNPPVN